MTVYFGMFHSHIINGCEVRSHHDAGCRELFLFQKNSVRLLSSAGFLDNCGSVSIGLGVMILYSQYILSSITNLKLKLNTFSTRIKHNSCSIRRNGYLDIPCCRLSKSKDCFPLVQPSTARYEELSLYKVQE